MKKSVKVLILLIVLFLIVAAGVKAIKNKKAREAAMPVAKVYAAVVSAITPKVENVILTLPYIALIQNDNDVVLSSKLSERILMIDKAGAHVKKGEVVAKLDTTDLYAKLQAIKAQVIAARVGMSAQKTALANIEAVHARTEKLLKVKGASQEQFDSEVTKIAAAKAAIAATKAKIDTLVQNAKEIANLIDYAVIKAPVSGTIGKAFVNSGDMAMPGKPLLSINAKNGNYMLLRMPDNVKPTLLIFKGKKVSLYPLHHTFNGLDEYRTSTMNIPYSSGERVNVDVVVFEGKGLKLPVDAVLNKGSNNVVLEAKNGHIKIIPVTIKAAGEQGVIVAQNSLIGKSLVVAKPDIMLSLLSGADVKIEK